jgi:hypothetical protein
MKVISGSYSYRMLMEPASKVSVPLPANAVVGELMPVVPESVIAN